MGVSRLWGMEPLPTILRDDDIDVTLYRFSMFYLDDHQLANARAESAYCYF